MSLIGAAHPYYTSESNYYSNDWPKYLESWEHFIEDWGDSDPDMNFVMRWDWWAPDPEFSDDEPPTHRLQITFVLQRKGIYAPLFVAVTDEDEPAVRAWLTERWKTVVAMWQPISPDSHVDLRPEEEE